MASMLSFVIPCYHSEQTLAAVVQEIFTTVEQDGRYTCEIVLVNDNPPDATWYLIEELCSHDARVKGICLMHNFGQHAALMAGFNHVSGDIVICLDDDGQTPPHETFKLVDALSDTVDCVYADYPHDKFANGFRRIGSYLNDLMARVLLRKPKGLYLSSYIAAKRQVIDHVIKYSGPFPYVDGLMLRSAGCIINVPVEHKAREQGESGYTLHKLLGLWLNGFTAFSIKPLRLATALGIFCAVVGFIITIAVTIKKLLGGADVESGWTSIICLQLIIGGLIMSMLGLIGEYIGRAYLSLNGAPQYLVRTELNYAEKPAEAAPLKQAETSRTAKESLLDNIDTSAPVS